MEAGMAKNPYYTPAQSFPGIIGMSIALTVMAAAIFGPKAVAEQFAQSAGTLWDAGVNAVQHVPALAGSLMQHLPR
jgi:hypothetical protein